MKYLNILPRRVPEGMALFHNHVRPTRSLNLRGFRAWLDKSEVKKEVCKCGWCPELGTHYMLTRDFVFSITENYITVDGKRIATIKPGRGRDGRGKRGEGLFRCVLWKDEIQQAS